MNTLDHIVAKTIRLYKHGEGIEELADHLGIKSSMLYRLSNPLDEEARINSKHLIPLMEKTKDPAVLRHITGRLGYCVFRMPRVRTARQTEIAEYQHRQAKAVHSLLAFFAGEKTSEETLDAIRAEVEAAAGFIKAIETRRQPELFEEEA